MLCGAPGTAQLEGAAGAAGASGDGLVSPVPPFAHPVTHAAAPTAIHHFTRSITTSASPLNECPHGHPASIRRHTREGQAACLRRCSRVKSLLSRNVRGGEQLQRPSHTGITPNRVAIHRSIPI